MPRSESDVEADKGVARTRRTGGSRHSRGADTASTTGTSPSEEFVGRVAGQDESEDEISGAEARSANERDHAADNNGDD